MANHEAISVTIPHKDKLSKMPTGIPSFDIIIQGGFPSGSVVLLTGEAGAGSTEFAYTSAAMLSSLKNLQSSSIIIQEKSLKLPECVCYISFAHSKEDILEELERAFPPEFARAWNNKDYFFKNFTPPPHSVATC